MNKLITLPAGASVPEAIMQMVSKAIEEGVPSNRIMCAMSVRTAARGLVNTYEKTPVSVFTRASFCWAYLHSQGLIPKRITLAYKVDVKAILDRIFESRKDDLRRCLEYLKEVKRFSGDDIAKNHLMRDASKVEHVIRQLRLKTRSDMFLYPGIRNMLLQYFPEKHLTSEWLAENSFTPSNPGETVSRQLYWEICIDLAKQFHDAKKKAHMMDGDDLLVLCYHYITKGVPDSYKSMFDLVIIGEASSMRPIEIETIRSLSNHGTSDLVFLVQEQEADSTFKTTSRDRIARLRSMCE